MPRMVSGKNLVFCFNLFEWQYCGPLKPYNCLSTIGSKHWKAFSDEGHPALTHSSHWTLFPWGIKCIISKGSANKIFKNVIIEAENHFREECKMWVLECSMTNWTTSPIPAALYSLHKLTFKAPDCAKCLIHIWHLTFMIILQISLIISVLQIKKLRPRE